ncbi:GEVED domain-containing protein [Winogradskyella sp.]|nr:GEVED domain-containing protein [Winogradskyella sp.]
MKTNYTNLTLMLSFVFLLGATALSYGQTTIYSNNFESNNGGWTDGGGDCEFRNNDSNSPQGNASWRIKDNSGNSSAFYQDFDLSGYDEITISFSFLSDDFNNDDDRFEVLIDDERIEEYKYEKEGWDDNRVRYTRSITLNRFDYDLNTTNQIKFETTKDTSNDMYLYIDEIEITGTNYDYDHLFFENFSDDTSSGNANDFFGTDDSGNNIVWTADEQGSADKWDINNGRWRGERVETESSFTTDPFSISGYSDLQFQFYIDYDNDLDNTTNEWIKVFYTIDGGTEELLEAYYGEDTDQTYTVDLPSDAVGDDIVLRIEMHHDSDKDEHDIDNIKLTGVYNPCEAPTAYAVTGSDLEYCTGGTDTTAIGLDNTQTGITYQLLRDDTSVGSAIAGTTGSAIDFGDFSAAGTYTVEATRTDGGCTTTMNNEVVITDNTPIANFTVSSTNLDTNNTITFNNTSTGNNTYTWSFGNGTPASTEENPTYIYTEAGTYTITLIASNACGSDTTTQEIVITETVVTYCNISEEDSSFQDGITSVEFGTIDNQTGIDNVDGYLNYTNISTDVVLGETIDLTVKINTDGNYGYYTNVWIDWNMDGIFNDNSELYNLGWVNNNSNDSRYNLIASGGPYSIEIPADATLGNTRMRIITKYNDSTFDACTNINYGEIEDYTIIIKEQTNTWTGNQNNPINNANNWSLGMVPDETQSIVIDDNAHLKINEELKFVSVTVKANAALTIDKQGSITTTKDFTVENGGSVNMLSELKSGYGMVNPNASENSKDQFSSLFVGGVASGNITYHRATRANRPSQGSPVLRNHVSSPVVNEVFNEDFVTENPDITTSGVYSGAYIFFTWMNNSGSWAYNYASQPATLVPGKGYLVGMGAADGNNTGNPNFELKFTGQIQNATQVDIAIDDNYNPWQHVGNPYASFLDMDLFLDHNMGSGAIVSQNSSMSGVYAWTGEGENTVAKYKVYNKISNSNLLRPGQGFFVRSSGGGGVITFKKEWLRLPNAGNPNDIDPNFSGRSSAPILNNYIRLKLTSENRFPTETEVYFNDEFGTNGLDVAYDTEVYGGQSANGFGLYTHLVEGSTGKDMAIQTLNNSNLPTHVIPLGVNLNAGTTATISLADLLLPEDTTVYLEDRTANVWTILNNVDYTFTANNNITDTGRFYIHFQDNSQTLSNTDFDLNTLEIKSITGAKTIVINGQLDTDSVLEIYDINGRKVMTKALDSDKTTNRIDASQLTTAAYIVRVHNTTQQVAQQVIIN